MLNPIKHGLREFFRISYAALVIDVLDRYDVNFSDIERVVGRSEILEIFMFSEVGRTFGHIVQVFELLVEIMIADTLEYGHSHVFHRFLVGLK